MSDGWTDATPDATPDATSDGAEMLQKVRMMGYSTMPLSVPVPIVCDDCGTTFTMTHYESACGGCGMIHAVTPRDAKDPSAVRPTGLRQADR